MAKILSFGHNDRELEKENPLKSLWEEFVSLDKFTRFFIITLILIVLATPFIIANYHLLKSYGESGAQRLKSIAQLQEFQQQFANFSSSTAKVAVTPPPASIPRNTASPLETIFAFLANTINYLLKIPASFFSNTGAK